MQRELSDLMDLVAALEQSAGSFVPEVMEAQILNPQKAAGPRERGTNALGVIREDVSLVWGCAATSAHASGVYFNRR